MKDKKIYPTDLLYKPINNGVFDITRQAFFTNKEPAYYNFLHAKQWSWLKDAFCRAVQQESREIISAFMNQRQATLANEFVLSMEQCLKYIECFYFIYQNDEPMFRLDNKTKKNFLSEVLHVMEEEICETGRFLLFEQIVIKYRADKNWLDNELQKQRSLILTIMQSNYNHEYAVDLGMEIHTLGVMQLAARAKNLGVPQLEHLSDIHMDKKTRKDIMDYFNKNYVGYFEQYERDVFQNISEHILFKLNELLQLNKINTSAWEKQRLTLPNGYQIKLMPRHKLLQQDEMEPDTIYLYLQDMHFQDEQIYGITKLGKPFPLIKETESVLNDITPNINFEDIKQLLRDGKKYSLPNIFQEQLIISLLTERGVSAYYAVNNAFLQFMHEYLQLDDLNTIKKDFFWKSDEQWILKPKQVCLRKIKQYTEEMLLNKQYFISTNNCYANDFDASKIDASKIYLRFKNNLIKKALQKRARFFKLYGVTTTTFLESLQSPQTTNIYLNYPFILLLPMKNNFHIITTMPSVYKANPRFMFEVLQFFSQQIKPYIDADDKEAICRMTGNLLRVLGDHTEYLDHLPHKLHKHYLVGQMLKEAKQNCLNANRWARLTLLEPTLSLVKLVSLTQTLSPHEFYQILQERARCRRMPLPYCYDLTFFQEFCQELPVAEQWNYLKYKLKLLDQKNPTIAAKYLLSTDYWFLAFMRYQHYYTYFDGYYDMKAHLKEIKSSCLALLEESLIVFNYSHLIVIYGILLALVIELKHELIKAPFSSVIFLSTSFYATSLLFSSEWSMGGLNWFSHTERKFSFWNESKRFLNRVWGTLIFATQNSLEENLMTNCEDRILKLQGLDNLCANQKAEWLKFILEKIKQTIPRDVFYSDDEIAKKLQREFDVKYKNKAHRLSFWKIAEHNCNSDAFDITALNRTANSLIK